MGSSPVAVTSFTISSFLWILFIQYETSYFIYQILNFVTCNHNVQRTQQLGIDSKFRFWYHANLTALSNVCPQLKSSRYLWFSHDFMGIWSKFIPLNLLNFRSKIWGRSITPMNYTTYGCFSNLNSTKRHVKNTKLTCSKYSN